MDDLLYNYLVPMVQSTEPSSSLSPTNTNSCPTDTIGTKATQFTEENINNNYNTVLLLISDPTAWQLHVFRTRYEHIIDFIWLDSSMYYPFLQDLETRVGPGTLMGIIKN